MNFGSPVDKIGINFKHVFLVSRLLSVGHSIVSAALLLALDITRCRIQFHEPSQLFNQTLIIGLSDSKAFVPVEKTNVGKLYRWLQLRAV